MSMSELAREKLFELCVRAVGDKLVYSCGEAPNYETYDFKTESIKAVPPKAWYVNKTANESEQYFTSGELYEYLSQLK